MSNLETRRALLDAARRVREVGWGKTWEGLCVISAINEGSTAPEHVKRDAFNELWRVLGVYPFDWNNNVCRSRGQAADMLERAASSISKVEGRA